MFLAPNVCKNAPGRIIAQDFEQIPSRLDFESRLAREASSLANYLAREFHSVGMCTHTTVSPTRRHTRSRGDQVEGKRRRWRRRRRSAHEREEKGNRKIRERRAAERRARRATIKIARSNRRA